MNEAYVAVSQIMNIVLIKRQIGLEGVLFWSVFKTSLYIIF